jgi:hypothetical protein
MGKFNRIATIVALSLPLLTAGCGGPRRVYVWGSGETTYYLQWEQETHRDHVEWERRSEAEHRAYWKWRRAHQ